MILHGKDLIVSIDGNAAFASKSCTLNVSAKSIVKTSPTSGDWEEILSGKKSWSLTTNQLVKASETATPETISSITAFEVHNTLAEGWHARGECRMSPTPGTAYIFDEVGMNGGIDVLRIDSTTCQLLENHHFGKDATGLNEYLNGNTIGSGDLLIIMSNGEFVLPANVVSTLSVTYHTALPFIEVGRVSQFGNTYDTAPIIIACGKNIPQGYSATNSLSNDIKFQLVNGTNFILDGIPGAIDMVGKTATIRMTDEHGSYIVGQAIVTQFKVTGTKGNLMAGSFSFKGNSELQINKTQDMPEDRDIFDNVDRIIIDMTKSNPAEMVTGDINGPIFQEIFKETHRYLFKYYRAGRAYICQLSDENSNQFYEGTSATLDGTQGDVYVRLHTYFKYRIVSVGYRKISFEVCTNTHVQLGNDWHEWSNNERLIAAFQMSATTTWKNNTPADPSEEAYYPRSIYNDNGPTPISYSTPMFNNMNPNFFGVVGPEEYTMIGLLYLAKYGSTNCQGMCGAGIATSMPTGATASMGMHDSTNFLGGIVNFLGLESWWGGKAEWMERINVTGSTWNITPLNQVSPISKTSGNNGVIMRMQFDAENLIMLPDYADNDENYQKGFCDAIEWEAGNTNNPVLKGGVGNGGNVGIFNLNAKTNAEGNINTTTRLCFNNSNNLIEMLTPQQFIEFEAENPAI